MFQKKILLIDDSQFSSRALINVLELAGYKVILALNGKDGLKMVAEEKPDLVLLDIIMPDIDGFEVCRILRNSESNNLMPIIMLTAKDNQEDKLVGLELGADDYITKPFNDRELLSRVRNTLRRIDQNRGANPLTGLCGNLEIQIELDSRIEGEAPFTVIYADLDNFKAYNDVYGFAKGDIAIKLTADILMGAVRDFGGSEDFIGHIGGDDFILIVDPEKADLICDGIILRFSERVDALYTAEDMAAGFIYAFDRLGEKTKFPIMSISLAVLTSKAHHFENHLQIAEVAAELKNKVKALPGSNFMKE